ncbi:MAG: ATP-binding protein [Syntrophobacterales bacterium]|nr:ATP-binding protein [Syntrophobacterales bacterium]
MTLRKRFLTTICLVSIVILGATYIVSQLTFVRSFSLIEEREALTRSKTILTYFTSIKKRLKSHAQDWAAWDETYHFVKNGDPEYRERNLMGETFKNLSISWMIFFDYNGNIIEEAGTSLPAPLELKNLLISRQEILKFEDTRSHPITGVINSSRGIILYALAPIVTSRYEGPIVGTLVLGRPIDEAMLSELTSSVGDSIKLFVAESPTKDKDKMQHLEILSENLLSISGIIPFDHNGIYFQVEFPREIFQEAQQTEWLFLTTVMMMTLVTLIVAWWFIDRGSLKELRKLKEEATKKIESNDFSPLISENLKTEEFKELTAVINALIENQEAAIISKIEQEKAILSLFDRLFIGTVLISKEDYKILWVNGTFFHITGFKPEDVIGKRCDETLCIESCSNSPVEIEEKGFDFKECKIKTSTGSVLEVLKSIVPVNYSGKECLFEAFVDITERKHLEEKLRRAEKFQTLGLIAGRVAHELNNLLTSLVIYPEFLLKTGNYTGKERHYLETMMRSSFRASELVEDLLTMTRRQLPLRDTVSMSNLVHEIATSPELEKLQTNYPLVDFIFFTRDSEDLCTLGSQAHIMRAVINLMKNSAEAIERAGKVEVSIFKRTLLEPYRGYEEIPPGDYVILEVRDTGRGISNEDLPYIFEPFYTTKKLGQSGTGLGMTVVWNVIKDMDGYIDLESTLGKGTTVRLFLPNKECEKNKPLAHVGTIDEGYESFNPLRVLVVDDLPEQREMASLILKQMGVEVTTASGMEDALEMLRLQNFDLVLLDMVLGSGPDGLEVARSILRERPNQSIAIVSGYGESTRVKEALHEGVLCCIKKPYRSEDITEVLKRIRVSNKQTP